MEKCQLCRFVTAMAKENYALRQSIDNPQTEATPDGPKVDYVSGPEELRTWLAEQFGADLDPEAEQILRDNLWNLYTEEDDDRSDG